MKRGRVCGSDGIDRGRRRRGIRRWEMRAYEIGERRRRVVGRTRVRRRRLDDVQFPKASLELVGRNSRRAALHRTTPSVFLSLDFRQCLLLLLFLSTFIETNPRELGRSLLLVHQTPFQRFQDQIRSEDRQSEVERN
jgi:hypothetical protein